MRGLVVGPFGIALRTPRGRILSSYEGIAIGDRGSGTVRLNRSQSGSFAPNNGRTLFWREGQRR